MCCSVRCNLWCSCVAVCCSMLQRACNNPKRVPWISCVAVRVIVCCSVMHRSWVPWISCVAVRGIVCCSVMHCLLVCCSVIHHSWRFACYRACKKPEWVPWISCVAVCVAVHCHTGCSACNNPIRFTWAPCVGVSWHKLAWVGVSCSDLQCMLQCMLQYMLQCNNHNCALSVSCGAVCVENCCSVLQGIPRLATISIFIYVYTYIYIFIYVYVGNIYIYTYIYIYVYVYM